MGLNPLSGKSVLKISRATGLDNIVRATVMSHHQHWYVWLTLTPHRHGVYDKRDGSVSLDLPGGTTLCTSLCRTLFPKGSGPAPSLIDGLPSVPGEPGGYHLRETTEGGYPLTGSSPAERAAMVVYAAHCKAQAMRDHPFIGEDPYCGAMLGPIFSGDSTTGVISMRIGCGYPRDTHPKAD